MVTLLQEYRDVFAFGSEEMLGIDPIVIEYKLSIDLIHKLFIQKKRHMDAERAAVATAEVHKLLEVGFISIANGYRTLS